MGSVQYVKEGSVPAFVEYSGSAAPWPFQRDFFTVYSVERVVPTTEPVLLASVPGKIADVTTGFVFSVPQSFLSTAFKLDCVSVRKVIDVSDEPRIVSNVLFPVYFCVVDLDLGITLFHRSLRDFS